MQSVKYECLLFFFTVELSRKLGMLLEGGEGGEGGDVAVDKAFWLQASLI